MSSVEREIANIIELPRIATNSSCELEKKFSVPSPKLYCDITLQFVDDILAPVRTRVGCGVDEKYPTVILNQRYTPCKQNVALYNVFRELYLREDWKRLAICKSPEIFFDDKDRSICSETKPPPCHVKAGAISRMLREGKACENLLREAVLKVFESRRLASLRRACRTLRTLTISAPTDSDSRSPNENEALTDYALSDYETINTKLFESMFLLGHELNAVSREAELLERQRTVTRTSAEICEREKTCGTTNVNENRRLLSPDNKECERRSEIKNDERNEKITVQKNDDVTRNQINCQKNESDNRFVFEENFLGERFLLVRHSCVERVSNDDYDFACDYSNSLKRAKKNTCENYACTIIHEQSERKSMPNAKPWTAFDEFMLDRCNYLSGFETVALENTFYTSIIAAHEAWTKSYDVSRHRASEENTRVNERQARNYTDSDVGNDDSASQPRADEPHMRRKSSVGSAADSNEEGDHDEASPMERRLRACNALTVKAFFGDGEINERKLRSGVFSKLNVAADANISARETDEDIFESVIKAHVEHEYPELFGCSSGRCVREKDENAKSPETATERKISRLVSNEKSNEINSSKALIANEYRGETLFYLGRALTHQGIFPVSCEAQNVSDASETVEVEVPTAYERLRRFETATDNYVKLPCCNPSVVLECKVFGSSPIMGEEKRERTREIVVKRKEKALALRTASTFLGNCLGNEGKRSATSSSNDGRDEIHTKREVALETTRDIAADEVENERECSNSSKKNSTNSRRESNRTNCAVTDFDICADADADSDAVSAESNYNDRAGRNVETNRRYFYVTDILRLGNEHVADWPWKHRRALLESIVYDHPDPVIDDDDDDNDDDDEYTESWFKRNVIQLPPYKVSSSLLEIHDYISRCHKRCSDGVVVRDVNGKYIIRERETSRRRAFKNMFLARKNRESCLYASPLKKFKFDCPNRGDYIFLQLERKILRTLTKSGALEAMNANVWRSRVHALAGKISALKERYICSAGATTETSVEKGNGRTSDAVNEQQYVDPGDNGDDTSLKLLKVLKSSFFDGCVVLRRVARTHIAILAAAVDRRVSFNARKHNSELRLREIFFGFVVAGDEYGYPEEGPKAICFFSLKGKQIFDEIATDVFSLIELGKLLPMVKLENLEKYRRKNRNSPLVRVTSEIQAMPHPSENETAMCDIFWKLPRDVIPTPDKAYVIRDVLEAPVWEIDSKDYFKHKFSDVYFLRKRDDMISLQATRIPEWRCMF